MDIVTKVYLWNCIEIALCVRMKKLLALSSCYSDALPVTSSLSTFHREFIVSGNAHCTFSLVVTSCVLVEHLHYENIPLQFSNAFFFV